MSKPPLVIFLTNKKLMGVEVHRMSDSDKLMYILLVVIGPGTERLHINSINNVCFLSSMEKYIRKES